MVSDSEAVVTTQAPGSPTVSVVSVWPATVTVTTVPAPESVVPEIAGVMSLVALVGPPLIEITGAVTSTVSVWSAVPTFCEASVTIASTLWGPRPGPSY